MEGIAKIKIEMKDWNDTEEDKTKLGWIGESLKDIMETGW